MGLCYMAETVTPVISSTSVTAVVRQAIDDHLAKQEKKGAKPP